MTGRLDGVSVLTQADRYMGPAIVELFGAEGARLTVDDGELAAAADVDALVARAGRVDVVVANFAWPRSAIR